ncbi:MAG: hypothetical protein IJH75_01110 [Mogibacterium sp.]|nr:hypothetical protein [Mogibacterium sp.]
MKVRQYQRAKDLKLPHAVHYQCIWIVRDRARLEALVRQKEQENGRSAAAETAAFHLECIRRALETVPECYRSGILDNIEGRRTGYEPYAHLNTWKRWKQRFLYELARELRLI